MKTRKLSQDLLKRLAYGSDDDGYITCADWIDRHSDIFFKSESSTMTYQFDCVCGDYRVFARPFRHRDWSILFLSKNARSVLQSLYDFLYV